MTIMEKSTNYMPPKLAAVAGTIRKDINVLNEGKRLHFSRKDVQKALDCDKFVDDDHILDMLKSKLSILEREKIFDGKGFNAGYEKFSITKDGDKVIFIEYSKTEEHREIPSLQEDDIMINDTAGEVEVLTRSGHTLNSGKFKEKLKEEHQEEIK